MKKEVKRSVRDVTEVVVGRKLEVVASLDLEEVGEKVGSLQGEVLDDEVDLLGGVLGAGDGNVADLLEKGGEDDGADVLPLGTRKKRAGSQLMVRHATEWG